jgi:putative transposase
MRVDQAKRLKELEQENAQQKKLLADLSLDNAILNEVNRGNFSSPVLLVHLILKIIFLVHSISS